jgi:hypothetical protein
LLSAPFFIEDTISVPVLQALRRRAEKFQIAGLASGRLCLYNKKNIKLETGAFRHGKKRQTPLR